MSRVHYTPRMSLPTTHLIHSTLLRSASVSSYSLDQLVDAGHLKLALEFMRKGFDATCELVEVGAGSLQVAERVA